MTDISNASDDDLVNLAASGDREALADLFARYRGRLKSFLRVRIDVRLQARVDPSDVLQEAYVDAADRVARYAENSSLPVYLWLRAVTGERLARLHRQHVAAKMRTADQEVALDRAGWCTSSVWLVKQLVGRLTTASEAFARAEVQAAVQQALEQVDEIDREILVLRHFEMMSNAEIA